MKPIIVDMNDMSESTEIYESKPNRFLVCTIYLILFTLIIAFAWMYFFKMDVVVKGNGMFKGLEDGTIISSTITGKVAKVYVTDGQYVQEGDVIYELKIENMDSTIEGYENSLKDVNDRIEILNAYKEAVDGNSAKFDALRDNKYYDEFVDRKELIYANIDTGNNDSVKVLYQESVDDLTVSIEEYNLKLQKLNQLKDCVKNRTNSFSETESYYYTMANNYISSYDYTGYQYDNKMEVSLDADKELLQKEKEQVLSNMELEELSSVEQQIETINSTISSMETSLISAKIQLESVSGTDDDEKVKLLSEKGNIEAEILTYTDKKSEYEKLLDNCITQSENSVVKANSTGFFYINQEIKLGTYIQEGSSLGQIYPEKQSKYYAEVYVSNEDIAKIRINQKVKFEIASYPSSEYGYFEGAVYDISKDITIDQTTGIAYYIVKAKFNDTEFENEDGEIQALKNGMATQAKVVVDEKSVLKYVLEKIDIVD